MRAYTGEELIQMMIQRRQATRRMEENILSKIMYERIEVEEEETCVIREIKDEEGEKE